MDEDILNSLPTAMFPGTPCSYQNQRRPSPLNCHKIIFTFYGVSLRELKHHNLLCSSL